MTKEKLREGLVIALIVSGFLWVLYLIFKIKGYAGVDLDSLSDEEIALIKNSIRTKIGRAHV